VLGWLSSQKASFIIHALWMEFGIWNQFFFGKWVEVMGVAFVGASARIAIGLKSKCCAYWYLFALSIAPHSIY
jgi:hypothetical protein